MGLAFACGEAERDLPPPTPAAAPASAPEPFAGKVTRSEVIRGAHRFDSGSQGIWFELEGVPRTRYFYYLESIERGKADGVLRNEADGAARYYDLAGLAVEGLARAGPMPAGRVVESIRVHETASNPPE